MNNLIEVSFNSEGMPQRCFVDPEALTRLGSKSCVYMHHANGSRMKMRWPGDKDQHNALLNVKNIVVRGNPKLPEGWEATTQAAYDAFWKEFTAKGQP